LGNRGKIHTSITTSGSMLSLKETLSLRGVTCWGVILAFDLTCRSVCAPLPTTTSYKRNAFLQPYTLYILSPISLCDSNLKYTVFQAITQFGVARRLRTRNFTILLERGASSYLSLCTNPPNNDKHGTSCSSALINMPYKMGI